MMLYMAPETVDMRKAAKDYHPSKDPGLTGIQGQGRLSATGTMVMPRWLHGQGKNNYDGAGVGNLERDRTVAPQ